MRFKTRRPGVKEIALRRWHKWFAWYPVRIPKTGKYVYWLEFVQRKKIMWLGWDGGWWERKYKLLEN